MSIDSDEGGSGRTRLLAVGGCAVETEYVPGGSLHTLRFPRPLAGSDVHDFAFRELLEDPEADSEAPKSDFAGSRSRRRRSSTGRRSPSSGTGRR